MIKGTMSNRIAWTPNRLKKAKGVSTAPFGTAEAKKARGFHSSFPEYQETPLDSLESLANSMGIAGLFVKDESFRFGLNAFKVLGASYAVARLLSKRLGIDVSQLDCTKLVSPEIRKQIGDVTFVTATDGNHGRGVAWTARQLRQKAVVYMPKGSLPTRLENIRAEGASASIIEGNYDDAVRLAAQGAREHGWVVVQDTAWQGYEEIPTWIMQGYGTIAAEAIEQLCRIGIKKPTHVFLQAGVGSFAGAIQGYFADLFGNDRPVTAIIEPDQSDCLYRSAVANDGNPRIITGEMTTIMAGLACGEPNRIAWELLRDYSDVFFSCPDWVAAKGMRMLGNPLNNDPCIISGESGAVTAGLLAALMKNAYLEDARAALGLDRNSRVLLISTEGDTDPTRYRSIVWDGEYPSYE
jgi:diaminopropionate ammonia-lyase